MAPQSCRARRSRSRVRSTAVQNDISVSASSFFLVNPSEHVAITRVCCWSVDRGVDRIKAFPDACTITAALGVLIDVGANVAALDTWSYRQTAKACGGCRCTTCRRLCPGAAL